jgi:transcriptional regulator with XRE-family HTH domain
MATAREQLADMLRQARLDAGYGSHGALARKLNVSRPVITKAENAAHPAPSDALLAAWAGVTGAPLDTLIELAQRAKSGTPDWFMPYRQAESEADTLRCWSPVQVPGLLQTEPYARATLAVELYTAERLAELVTRPRTRTGQPGGAAEVTATSAWAPVPSMNSSPAVDELQSGQVHDQPPGQTVQGLPGQDGGGGDVQLAADRQHADLPVLLDDDVQLRHAHHGAPKVHSRAAWRVVAIPPAARSLPGPSYTATITRTGMTSGHLE